MKTPLSFLLLFLFLLVFGQTKENSYEYRKQKYEETVYNELMKESKIMNLKKFDKIVLGSIDESKLKKENVVFLIQDLDIKIFYYYEDVYSYTSSKARCPYYTQAIFWNVKNVKYLVNKFRKNFIPKKYGVEFGFINEKDKNILKHIDNKVFAKDLLNQKKGKYVEINKGKIFEKEILFFPYNRNNLELKVIGNENVNFDTVRIEFQNFIGKVIGFKIIYYGNEKELTQKTYQYQNKNWVEIPTTDEYKF